MRIVANGVKGYMRKRDRRMKSGKSKRIHLTAEESQGSRIRKRLLGKSSWYKKRGGANDEQGGDKAGNSRSRSEESSLLKTRAVLFIEQSPQGELARRMKDQLRSLEATLGYRVKVVERTGRSLKSILAQGLGQGGQVCGRGACVTCGQEGDEKPPCTISSVVYESVCKPCNPGCTGKGEVEYQGEKHPSLYVGETSRTIQERAVEHWSQARKGDLKSHMVRHQAQLHPGEPPSFHFKLISTHRSALSRQVREAVRIRRRGGEGHILNSKGEFNRCHIPRLVLEEEDDDAKKTRLEREQQEKRDLKDCLDKEVECWELGKHRERDLKEKKRGRDQDRGLESPRCSQAEVGTRKRRKVKAKKFATVGEDWGEDEGLDSGQDRDEIPPPPVIGRSGDTANPVMLMKKRDLISSTITDFFSPRAKRSRMERCDGDRWSDDEWFEENTQQYVGCVEVEKKDAEELEWSDDEWFSGATQQYLEDRLPSAVCVEKEECATGELLLQDGDDDEFVEFQVDSSFDEWTASFLGRESLGCGRAEGTKEMIVDGDDETPLPPAENAAVGDPRAGVGHQCEAQASELPAGVSEETNGPTATHPGDEADDRSISEREDVTRERVLETDPGEGARLVTNSSGVGVDDEMPGQDATRPDSEERHEVEPVTAVCQLEQAVSKNDIARKRGKLEGVALLDSNQDMS